MTSSYKLVQCNLNHSWGAHNLLQQNIQEQDFSIAIVSEPVCIPKNDWYSSLDKNSAIHWRSRYVKHRCKLLFRGNGHVAMQYGDLAIFSCYISPNCSLLEYEKFIEELDMNIKRCNTRHILLGGDFNAKSVY